MDCSVLSCYSSYVSKERLSLILLNGCTLWCGYKQWHECINWVKAEFTPVREQCDMRHCICWASVLYYNGIVGATDCSMEIWELLISAYGKLSWLLGAGNRGTWICEGGQAVMCEWCNYHEWGMYPGSLFIHIQYTVKLRDGSIPSWHGSTHLNSSKNGLEPSTCKFSLTHCLFVFPSIFPSPSSITLKVKLALGKSLTHCLASGHSIINLRFPHLMPLH